MAREPKMESFLNRQAVRFEYREAIKLDDINNKASLDNQARLTGKLDAEIVAQYALAMRGGDEFPAIIGYQSDKGIIAIDGNHRIHAAIANQAETIDAYLILTDDAFIVEILTRSLNGKNGVRPSTAELIEQALFIMERYPGRTQSEIAGRFGLDPARLSKVKKRKATANRLTKKGVDVGKIPSPTLEILAPIHDDTILAEAAKTIIAGKLNNATVSLFTRDLCDAREKEIQEAVIEKWRDLPEIRKGMEDSAGGKYRVTNRTRERLFQAVRRLKNHLATYNTIEKNQITSTADVELLQTEWQEARTRMEEMLAKYQEHRLAGLAAADNGRRPMAQPAGVGGGS